MELKLESTDILKTKSTEYDFEKDGNPRLLEEKMIEIMIANRGIGLAANQLGFDKRIFVMGAESYLNFPKPTAMFNPKIIETSKNNVQDLEGCLSFPGLFLSVNRPDWIVGGFFDSNGSYHEEKFIGYAAKCFQHELDHLDGICFVDKVSKLKLQLALKKQRKKK